MSSSPASTDIDSSLRYSSVGTRALPRLARCEGAEQAVVLAVEVDHLDGDGGLGGLLDLISSHQATLRGVSSVTLGSIGPESRGTLRARYGQAGGRRRPALRRNSSHRGQVGPWVAETPAVGPPPLGRPARAAS